MFRLPKQDSPDFPSGQNRTLPVAPAGASRSYFAFRVIARNSSGSELVAARPDRHEM
uniref:Uncharacterized protein n=1 Tax=Ralstonia solanacearum TaxID=305 RepID=A0A0S4WM53_RALSL|nr:protein of unknown function [Ralstonia solanacearum]CUV23404.1 protein of unknown function [Ralstonia solanacearum]CUV27515.1 protein of unknown function [Ralstonia solanacearum]CUV35500.1 protein of unknown function [Ralstonia solanacearum]CUV40156.1 protein of unknown function [Ralstonia solanacearum]